MFWIATVLLIAFVFAFIVTFIIDPTSYLYVKVQKIRPYAYTKRVRGVFKHIRSEDR